jgi:diketogulonate reductase-like aldo/keto reductase
MLYYRTEADVGRGIQKSGVRRGDIFVDGGIILKINVSTHLTWV